MDWFGMISERLRDYSDGEIWSDGDEILCRTGGITDVFSKLQLEKYESLANKFRKVLDTNSKRIEVVR